MTILLKTSGECDADVNKNCRDTIQKLANVEQTFRQDKNNALYANWICYFFLIPFLYIPFNRQLLVQWSESRAFCCWMRQRVLWTRKVKRYIIILVWVNKNPKKCTQFRQFSAHLKVLVKTELLWQLFIAWEVKILPPSNNKSLFIV